MGLRLATASVPTACAVAGGALAASAQATPPAPAASSTTSSAGAHSAPAATKRKAKCPYPYVCFYKGRKIITTYKDTGYWQKLGAGRKATSVKNTRNDDIVYIRFAHYNPICVNRHMSRKFGQPRPTQVYIGKKSVCSF